MASAGKGLDFDPDLLDPQDAFFDSYENPRVVGSQHSEDDDEASTPEPTNDKPEKKDPFLARSGLKRQHTELSKRARVLVQQVKRGRVPEDYPQLIVWRDQLNSLYNDALAKHQEHVGAFVLSPKGWKKADKWESDFRRDHQVIMAIILEALALQPKMGPSATSTTTTNAGDVQPKSSNEEQPNGAGSTGPPTDAEDVQPKSSNPDPPTGAGPAGASADDEDVKPKTVPEDLKWLIKEVKEIADTNKSIVGNNNALADTLKKLQVDLDESVKSFKSSLETRFQESEKRLEEKIYQTVKASEWNVEGRIKMVDDRLKDFETSNSDRFNVLTSQVQSTESTVRVLEGKFTELHQKAGQLDQLLKEVKTAQTDATPSTSQHGQPAAVPKVTVTDSSTVTIGGVEREVQRRRQLMESRKNPEVSTSTPKTTIRRPEIQGTAAGPSGATNFDNDPSFEYRQPAEAEFVTASQVMKLVHMTRLPPVPIQKFDGNPKNYERFKSKFMLMYHRQFEDDDYRMALLEELLTENVRDTIGECLGDGKMYNVVWERLDDEYGHRTVMDKTYLNNLLLIPTLKSNDATSLKSFAISLHGAVAALDRSKYSSDLKSETVLIILESKLTSSLREKWAEKKKREYPKEHTVFDFDDWITTKSKGKEVGKTFLEVSMASKSSGKSSESKDAKSSKTKTSPLHVHHIDTSSSLSSPKVMAATAYEGKAHPSMPIAAEKPKSKEKSESACYVCPGKAHKLVNCYVFLSLSPSQRAETVFKAGRCVSCLTGNHRSKECTRKLKCAVPGCADPRHPTLLHGSEFVFPKKATGPFGGPSAPPAEGYVGTISRSGALASRIIFKIVPIRVRAGSRSFDTYAFLDGGSNSTLIRNDVAREMLHLTGPAQMIKVSLYDGEKKIVPARVVSFEITTRDESRRFKVRRGYSIDELEVRRNPKVAEEEMESWPHLRGIKFLPIGPDEVTILIGMDIASAQNHSESREPEDDATGPVAFNTPFGWCVAGDMGPPSSENDPFVAYFSPDEYPPLQDLIERFWRMDAKEVHLEHPVRSEEDLRGEEILKSTIQNVGNRYKIGLMWSTDNPQLPDNRTVALSRLFALERRFNRDPEFAAKYQAVVEDYIKLGHARLLSAEEVRHKTGKTWYLPHHGVVSSSSSSMKVRVVFDAAAEFNGVSLNDLLLRGPDYLVRQEGVLLRFRRNPIPICGDIEKMFHQVRVLEEDQVSFRFLYRPPGSSAPPLTYQMTVHVFGAKSSPSTCIFALNRTADDNREKYPAAADSVRKCFYVDNYMDSLESEDEVVKRARDMRSLLALGGFNLTKWSSSSKPVLAALQSFGLADPTLDLDRDELPVERTLGVHWDRQSDSFTFRIQNKLEKDTSVTKRVFLSVLMSVYDPLGLVAPIVFSMKSMLQETFDEEIKIDFDDELPEDLLRRFKEWYGTLPRLEDVQVARCFRLQAQKVAQQKLHVFTDASQKGYGAVAYLRNEYEDGQIDVSFVMAKTRVAPRSRYTIPRLELQGAIEGLELAILIVRELQWSLKDVTFHVDSQTTLRWIHSKKCKFEVFVANRIGKILRNTDRRQWRHVPGKCNPADFCSRGIDPKNVHELEEFHQGPAFLRQDPSCWPSWEAINEPDEFDSEVIQVHTLKIEKSRHPIDELVERRSRLLRIQRVVGWCLRYLSNLRARSKKESLSSGELTAAEMKRALTTCIQRAQNIAFHEEIHLLSKGGDIPSRSSIKCLTPYVDSEGLVRVGGRLENAPLDYDCRHPIVLPSDQRFTHLMIWDYHVQNFHVKTERLLSDLRTKYWITSGRRVVRSVLNKCIPCKRRDARPEPPIMGPLPIHRLTPHVPVFGHTGIDYFGPMQVTMGQRGRRFEKRWICLFTCLTVRAVHLEVADSLSLDAFLLAFTRFISVRGKPSVVYSDNGTNFVAAAKELKEAVGDLVKQETELKVKMANDEIEWHFSPPHGPHFGGAWERLVQSAKRALQVKMGTQVTTDQVLRTHITEVMALLNSRPLTQLSFEPTDPDPLTPNHFLLGRKSSYVQLQLSDLSGVRKRDYEQAQQLTDHFWKRWMKECVSGLLERRKWNEHRRNMQVNDIVLVIDPSTPKGQWPLGRVVEVMPSETDHVVRVVKVLIAGHSKPLERPVTKLCMLIRQDVEQAPTKEECEEKVDYKLKLRPRQS